MHRNPSSKMFLWHDWKEKNLKHLSVGESFGCSPFWMKQKFFQWQTSNNWKTPCVAKYALWWVEKLSDSTVFLTLDRVYQIYNHKFSQNHASETHGSTDSIVVAGYTRKCVFQKVIARNTEEIDCNLWMRNLALADMMNSHYYTSRTTDPAYTQTCNLMVDWTSSTSIFQWQEASGKTSLPLICFKSDLHRQVINVVKNEEICPKRVKTQRQGGKKASLDQSLTQTAQYVTPDKLIFICCKSFNAVFW